MVGKGVKNRGLAACFCSCLTGAARFILAKPPRTFGGNLANVETDVSIPDTFFVSLNVLYLVQCQLQI